MRCLSGIEEDARVCVFERCDRALKKIAVRNLGARIILASARFTAFALGMVRGTDAESRAYPSLTVSIAVGIQEQQPQRPH
jgi:hypothetical protein